MENGVMAFVSLHLFLLFGVIPVACHRYGGNFIFEPFPFIFAKGKGQCAQVLVKMRQFCRSGYRHNPRFFFAKSQLESQLRRRHAIFASEALKHIYNAVVGPHSLGGEAWQGVAVVVVGSNTVYSLRSPPRNPCSLDCKAQSLFPIHGTHRAPRFAQPRGA